MHATKTTEKHSEFGTLPETARRYGIGLKMLRRPAKEGAFLVHACGAGWARVRNSKFEAAAQVDSDRRPKVDRMTARELSRDNFGARWRA